MRRRFFNIYEQTSDGDGPQATGQSAHVARGEPGTSETRGHERKTPPSVTKSAEGHGGYPAASTPTPTTPLNRSQDVVKGSAFSGSSWRPWPGTPTATLPNSGVEADSTAARSRAHGTGGGQVNRSLFASPPRMPPPKIAGTPSNLAPATPLVAPSPQVHERGPDGGSGLPGMIPTPFLPTCEDPHANVRGTDTSVRGDAAGDDAASRAMVQIKMLWAQIQASRGTMDSVATAHGGVPNFTLRADLQAALAGMECKEAEESSKRAVEASPAVEPQAAVWRPNGRPVDAPQQSGVRREAAPETQAPTRSARVDSELPPVAAAFAAPNRGFAMNRLAGAGRLAVVGNPMARRVGGEGLRTAPGMPAGSVAPDGAGWDRHVPPIAQGRGVKRDRSRITIVVDYNPNDARPDLQPGMPPASAIHFYAKKAMHMLLRSCATHGVTYWPTDEERNVALLVVLRCHYDVCQLDVDRAMENGAYSKVVNKLWSKFRSDSSSQARRCTVDGLQIEVEAPGVYKLEIDIETKKSLWGRYAPSEWLWAQAGYRGGDVAGAAGVHVELRGGGFAAFYFEGFLPSMLRGLSRVAVWRQHGAGAIPHRLGVVFGESVTYFPVVLPPLRMAI
ncbi:unnamed protein product [Closterium sp. Yama58-4]|nr:unnamed protein product [Closterium sp. Yama58-4]